MSVYVYKDRCERLAEYLIENNSTVRATAAHFGISKSTVHKDVSERLNIINPLLYEQVKNDIALAKRQHIVATTLDGILTVDGKCKKKG